MPALRITVEGDHVIICLPQVTRVVVMPFEAANEAAALMDVAVACAERFDGIVPARPSDPRSVSIEVDRVNVVLVLDRLASFFQLPALAASQLAAGLRAKAKEAECYSQAHKIADDQETLNRAGVPINLLTKQIAAEAPGIASNCIVGRPTLSHSPLLRQEVRRGRR